VVLRLSNREKKGSLLGMTINRSTFFLKEHARLTQPGRNSWVVGNRGERRQHTGRRSGTLWNLLCDGIRLSRKVLQRVTSEN